MISDEKVEPNTFLLADQGDGSSGLGIDKGVIVGMLTVACAILLAVGTPQAASAGLLSELNRGGGIDYETESQGGAIKNKKLRQAMSRFQVLDNAAQGAQQKALQAQRELAEKEEAESEFRQVDEQKKAQEAEDRARTDKRQAQREKLRAMLESRSSTGADTSKAAQVFGEFKSNRDKLIAKKEEDAKKEDALRASALKSLDERRESAKRAAEEAEAIAKRIEELAINAREAADLAKRSAELLK